MSAMAGREQIERALREIAARAAGGGVEVGFMEDAKYSDGTQVAAVAFSNEFGVPENHQPPRPFFRRMIAAKKSGWGAQLAANFVGAAGDAKRALGLLGEEIASDLKISINELVDPPLSPTTVALKGFDKPLIDTGHMRDSVTYRVTDE
jgi:hypothetical protein